MHLWIWIRRIDHPQPCKAMLNNPDSQLNSYLTLRWPGNKATEITYIHTLTDDDNWRLNLLVFLESLLSSPWMQLVRIFLGTLFVICFFPSLFSFFFSLCLYFSGLLCCMSQLAVRGFCQGESAAEDLGMLRTVLQCGVTLWKLKYEQGAYVYWNNSRIKSDGLCVSVCVEGH